MKILILSQYYPPETGACANRISGFARHLAVSGHEVTVITGFPNYPHCKLYPGFRRVWCQKDVDGQVKLWRSWLSIRYPKSPLDRFMNYLGFFISSLYASFFKVGRPNVVVATSGPILVGLAGALVSLGKRRPFILDLRDVWPERIVAAGEFKNPVAVKILEWIEKFIYWRAIRIVCATRGLAARLQQKGVPSDKLMVITNGTNTEVFKKADGEDGEILTALGIPRDSFLVVYAGTLGLFQDHEMILEAARRLSSTPDIIFLMIGEGVKRDFLQNEAKNRVLKNLRFLPNLPQNEVAEIFRSAKIGINTNTHIQHNRMAIPVKMFDYMASELPVVLANEGEVQAIVEKGGVGICTPPGDAAQFSGAILKLYHDSKQRTEMGRRGRALVLQRYSIRSLSIEFEAVIQSIGNKK